MFSTSFRVLKRMQHKYANSGCHKAATTTASRVGARVAGRRRADVDLVPDVGEADERPGAKELRVVRMSEERERDFSFNHDGGDYSG